MPPVFGGLLGFPQGASEPEDEGTGLDPKVAELLASLLGQLESGPAPAPPTPPPPARGMQKLAQAIGNFRARLAGRGPQYQYEQDVEEYEKQQQAIEAARRMLRNNIRIGAFEEQQRKERELALAAAKPTTATRLQRSEFVRDVNGTPRRIRQLIDPQTGEILDEVDLGPAGYPPVIMPGMVIGPEGQQSRFIKIPKTGGATSVVPGPGGAQLEPQMPPGMIESLGGEQGVVAGIPQVMDVFNQAAETVGGSEDKLNQIKNWLQAKAAGTSAGPILAPPDMVNYFASVRSILFPYVKSISGAAFPETELRRYEAQFPIPGVDTPEIAQHKWNVVIQQMTRDIKAKYRTAGRTPPPGATTPPATGDPVEEYKRYLEQLRQEQPFATNP